MLTIISIAAILIWFFNFIGVVVFNNTSFINVALYISFISISLVASGIGFIQEDALLMGITLIVLGISFVVYNIYETIKYSKEELIIK